MAKAVKIAYIFILAILFPLAGNGLAQWRGYGEHMGPGMMGWGYGMGWIGMILMPGARSTRRSTRKKRRTSPDSIDWTSHHDFSL
jgi:hypothetical protein